MPRKHLCIICAALTALFAILLMLAPSPATAQDEPAEAHATSVSFGEGEALVGSVRTTVKMIGSDKPLGDFKLLVMAKHEDGSSTTKTGFTSDKGSLLIELRAKPAELRVFAYGDYMIPEGWSNIPLTKLELGEKPADWVVEVRPLKRVKVTGTISVQGLDTKPERASIAFAPLDVGQDGSVRMFDEPRSTLSSEGGKYEIELPSGYYKVWCYWADRTTDDWTGYIKVNGQTGIFEDTVIDLELIKGPTLEGKVVDARTGEGIPASINLYTNQYLRQLRIFTSDGKYPNETKPDGEEIIWPVGTFKKQIFMVDPNDFTVVIRPAGSDQILRVIDDVKLEDIVGKQITWELYTEDMRVVDVKVTTQTHALPVNNLDINLLPIQIDVPDHLQQSYTASGITQDDGVVRFMGLATGTYEVYGSRGSTFLGKLEVTKESVQETNVVFEIPFAYGKIKLANGEVCKHLEVFVWLTNKAGQEFGPYPSSAFKDNPILQKDGTVFVPLLSNGSTFRFRFAAMQDGKEFGDADWVKISDFPLATEDTVILVDSEKAWELDLKLAPNPNYKPKEEPEDPEGDQPEDD